MEPIERTRSGKVADQDAFFQKAALVFQNPSDGERRGDVLRSLISCNLLIPFLRARTELSVEQIAEILRLAMPLLPSVDMKLARYLCDERYGIDHETLLKFLGALARVSHPLRIASTLLPLLTDPDSRVRSKAARLVNVGDDDKVWREAETDPRVLANLVEALWDVETPHRRARFWKAVHSSSPRVAGNALVGLYRIGDQQAKSLILHMAEHPAAEFRRTAVWAMGETGDAEFVACLSGLLKSESGSVRVNALRALTRIRKRLAAATPVEAAAEPPPQPAADAAPPGYVY